MKNAILISLLFLTFNGFAQITCPDNITINCDQDYTDTLVIGSPIIADSINVNDINVDFNILLNSCSAGTISVAYSLDSNVICTQILTVENPFNALDSNTIVFPKDTMYVTCNRPYENPTWTAADCEFVRFSEMIDTISLVSDWEFTLERTITVIDWCLYNETGGAEGLYSGSHLISVLDQTPPLAACFSIFNLSPSEFPRTFEAEYFNWASYDACTYYTDLRFTFSDIPPEQDPNFDASINSSIREIHITEFEETQLYVDVYCWDPAGNYGYCTVYFAIIAEQCSNQVDHPLVDNRNQWTIRETSVSKQRFKPESVYIQGRQYKQLEISQVNEEEWSDSELSMSECDGQLYGRKNGITTLYFDFNLEVGDTLFSDQYIGEVDLKIDAVNDVTYYDGSIRKTVTVEAVNGYGFFDMIEGIGSTIFALTEFENVGQIGFDKEVICFTEDEEIVYTDLSLLSCISSNLLCPPNITINCDQDYTDMQLTGSPNILGSSNEDSISVIYFTQLNACGVGYVLARHKYVDSTICTQIITIENPFPLFAPSEIIFPNDTMFTTCEYQLDPPEWIGGPCDFIGYTEEIDTVSMVSEWELTLERSITVIDWCLYDLTDGEEGLFFHTQLININCESVNVDDQLEDDVVSIYPNPGNSFLNLKTTLDANLSIHALDGSQMHRKNITVGTLEINTQDWTKGIYLITISTKEGNITKRWVKL